MWIEEDIVEDAQADDAVSMIPRIRGLVSQAAHPYVPRPILEAFGPEVQDRPYPHFLRGETLSVRFEMPANGNLVVLHCFQAGKVEFAFPKTSRETPFLPSGHITIMNYTVTGALGRRFFKAFWARHQLLDFSSVNFEDEFEVEFALEKFIEAIEKSKEEDWLDMLCEYEVVPDSKTTD